MPDPALERAASGTDYRGVHEPGGGGGCEWLPAVVVDRGGASLPEVWTGGRLCAGVEQALVVVVNDLGWLR